MIGTLGASLPWMFKTDERQGNPVLRLMKWVVRVQVVWKEKELT